MRSRHALVPLAGSGTDLDPYRADLRPGTSHAASIPTDKYGHPIADYALVHLWGDDDALGEIDDAGVVFDRHATRLDELPASVRSRYRSALRAARRPVATGSGALVRHLIREGGRVLEPLFHESNLAVGAPQLAGGAPLTDTFTGTSGSALTAHTSDSGHSWSIWTAFNNSGAVISSADRVRGGTGTCPMTASYAPPTATYDIAFDEKYFSSAACFCGVFARATGTSTVDAYAAYFRLDLNEAHIYKWVSGSSTDLGTWAASQIDYTGNTFKVRDATKKFFVAGTERISTTDNAVTSAGKVGLYMYQATDSTGVHLDNLAVTEITEIIAVPHSVSVALPAPTVTATAPNGNVTAVPLSVSASLPAPAVSTTTTVWGDTFTDSDGTLLSSHTPTGPYASGTWTAWYTPTTSRLSISSNRVRASNSSAVSTTAEYHHSQSLTDGYIEADFTALTAAGNAVIGFRHVGTSTADGAWDAYRVQLAGSSGVITLDSVKAGSLGTYTIPSFATNTAYTIRLRIVGSSLKVYVNGTQQISVTNTSISAGGVALLQITSPDGTSTTTGIQVDNLVMSSSTAADATVAAAPLAVAVTAPPPAVAASSNATITVTAAGVPLLFGDQTPLFGVAGLPPPGVSTTIGGGSATVVSPALAVSGVLSPPAVTTTTGPTIVSPALAVSAAITPPAVTTTISGAVTVVAPALTAAIGLRTPNSTSETAYYWLRARRRDMSAPIKKTYVEVQAKGTTRTATWTSPTYKAETEAGVLVVLDVTSASGTGGLTLRINAHDQASSQPVALNAAPTAVTSTGTTSYALYPFGAVAGNVTQATSFYLPRLFSITVSHGDSSSYAYSVGFCLLP